MTLRELKIGESAVVTAVGGQGALRQHFLDMGLLPGVEVKLLKFAPMGDPMELLVRGYTLSLRLEEAALIEVKKEPKGTVLFGSISEKEPNGARPKGTLSQSEATERTVPFGSLADDFGYNLSLHEHNSHPGLGEAGKYHDATHESPLPKGTILRFALAGQQNCGKTTLFNQLTGSNQHVGNFPGVTVDRKDGQIKGHPDTLVTDLPGIYSLSPYTQEETVSRQFIIEQKPNCIINIVDATNIERNLYLTVQLMELGVPMVLALNMMDELTGNGGSVRVNEMERILGIPVVPISAAKGEGIKELVEHAIHVAEYQERPARTDFCTKDEHGGAVHRCLHSIMHLVEDHTERAGIPGRFAAGKLAEGDAQVLEALGLTQNGKETMEHIILQMEEERGMDRAAAIADMRFSFIERLCNQTVIKPQKSREYIRSRRIDRVLTGRWTAIPIFLIVMCLVIWLSIDVLGAPLQDWLDQLIQGLAGICVAGMEKADISPAIISLVEDGIFGGVGSVLSFVPIIIILFFFLSLIEDSGYMARIAFVTDTLLRKLGLSGRAVAHRLWMFCSGCNGYQDAAIGP